MKNIRLLPPTNFKAGRLMFIFSFFLTMMFSLSSFSANAQYAKCVKGDYDVVTDGLTAKFKSTTSGPVLIQYWYFDNTLIGKGSEVKYTFSKSGTYKVCLILLGYDTVNQQRCKFEYCDEVTVKKPCDLITKFDFKTDGKKALFEATSNSKHTVYSWRFGDGSKGKGRVVRHEYDSAGSYKVCVIAEDTVTGCKADFCKEIKLDSCDLRIEFDKRTDDLIAGFEAKSNSHNATYYWNFGDGEKGRGRVIRHKYDKEGKYEVCLTVIDTVTHCKARVCHWIKIEKDCDLEAKFGFKLDSNRLVVEGVSNSKHAIYFWNFGDGHEGKGRVARHKYVKPGKYEVCLIVKDTVTDCKVRVCKLIEVGKDECELKGDFHFKTDGNLVILEAKSNEDHVRYIWRIGDDTLTGKLVRHKLRAGTHKVCLTIIDKDNECKVTICKRVTIDDCDLSVNFRYEKKDSVFYFGAESNADKVRFVWSFGDGAVAVGPKARHSYKKPGVYTVCVTAVDLVTGCTETKCKEIRIKPDCDLRADFAYSVYPNGKVRFTVLTNDKHAKIRWYFGDGKTSSGRRPAHRYKKSGKYTVCLVVESKNGCKEKICKDIIVTVPKREQKRDDRDDRKPEFDDDHKKNHKDDLDDDHKKSDDDDDEELKDDRSRLNTDWNIKLSPNPVSGKAIVTIEGEKGSKIEVINMQGSILRSLRMDGTSTTLNLGDLERGYYFIRVTGSNGTAKQIKFLRQ